MVCYCEARNTLLVLDANEPARAVSLFLPAPSSIPFFLPAFPSTPAELAFPHLLPFTAGLSLKLCWLHLIAFAAGMISNLDTLPSPLSQSRLLLRAKPAPNFPPGGPGGPAPGGLAAPLFPISYAHVVGIPDGFSVRWGTGPPYPPGK